MIYDPTKTKPGAGTPGFAHSTSRLFAHIPYRIGTTGAIALCAFLLIAFDGAGGGRTLLRGALL